MKHFIIIPLFNDWKSLDKLLVKLDENLKSIKKIKSEVLVINDNSSEKINLKKRSFTTIKNIKIISLKKNFGSQIAIAVGLNYLKKEKKNFYVTVMDSDGEDSPSQVSVMLKTAIAHQDFIITSNRKKRKESFLIIFLYKIHLLLTFVFTQKWISFGNFSTFHKKNLKKILLNNYSIYAHSSSILKNCKIKRLYAKRERRFFDKSKLGILSLINHSLRVNSVFYKNIFFSSLIYSFFFLLFLNSNIGDFFVYQILLYNLLILSVKIKYIKLNINNLGEIIEDIRSPRTN
tara:strand:- start:5210 stop:6076 length:867 start_codon:yes stop_codon:yes gene_type:complete